MSKLDELIQELCPDGVEYFNVKELTKKKTIKTITPSIKIKRNDYQENGITPIISQELEYISGYCDFTDNSIPKNNYVCFGDHSEHIKFVDFAFVQGADGLKIMSLDEEKLMAKFFYYAISSFYVRHNNYERHFKYLNETEIPVPPLEVQREIVRILDSFTLLTAELTAELIARKKQYEYYRDYLLTHKTHIVENKKISDIADIYLGLTYTPTYVESGITFISSQNISNDYLNLTNVKYISEEEYKKCTSNAKPKKGDILFTRVGSNLGHPTIIETNIPLCIFVSLGYLRVKEGICNRYIKHWMNSDFFWSQVRKKTQNSPKVNLNSGWMRDFDIAIPPLNIQEKIADVLDNFDTICSDLSSGLPAEIEARQKQYEFYRDKLLTFKQL